MIGLTDQQLDVILTAAKSVERDRRDIFLQRVAAMLTLRGIFTDDDVVEVTALALRGLVQHMETANG